jgi:hypothetical protein
MLVIAIDQAIKSGWGIARPHHGVPGNVLASGVARNAHQIQSAIALALSLLEPEEALVAVLEDHSGMPLSRKTKHDRKGPRFGRAATTLADLKPTVERGTATVLGMGAARGWWEHALALTVVPWHRTGVPIVKVEPKVWRREVLGIVGGVPTDACKRRAVQHAQAVLGRQVEDDNEGEAVCMVLWAGRNVAEPTTKRRRKA